MKFCEPCRKTSCTTRSVFRQRLKARWNCKDNKSGQMLCEEKVVRKRWKEYCIAFTGKNYVQ